MGKTNDVKQQQEEKKLAFIRGFIVGVGAMLLISILLQIM